jgi:hypothetical protein
VPQPDGSYLQRIVSRATADGSGTLRPRRLIYPSSPVPPAESPPAPLITAAGAPIPPDVPSASPPAVALASPPSAVTSRESPAQPAAPAPTSPSTASVAAAAGPAAADSPRVTVAKEGQASTRPVDETMPTEQPRAEPAASSTTTNDPVRSPGEPHRATALRRDTRPAPDPLALALAAAVRWTSSGERSETVATSPGRPVDPPAAITPSDAPSLLSAEVPREEPGTAQPSPYHALTTARPPAAERQAPSAPRRFGGVHIGSIEVRVQPPSAPAPPPVPPPHAPSSTAPAIPLARGLTSSLGLRQS